MTLEEACRLIDPATDLDALAEIEYYNGFKGKDAAAKALHEASQRSLTLCARCHGMMPRTRQSPMKKAGNAPAKSTAP